MCRSRFLRREDWRRQCLWELLKVARRSCKVNAPATVWVGETAVHDLVKKLLSQPKKKKRRGRFGRRRANPNLAIVPAPQPQATALEAAMKDLLDEVEAQPELLEELEQQEQDSYHMCENGTNSHKNSDFWQIP